MPPDSEPAAGSAELPAVYERHQFASITVVLVAITLYFNFGHLLSIPGVFGEIDKRSAQVTFNEWMWLSVIVTGFYLVFGVAGRFAFSTASFVGVGAYSSHYATSSGNNWAVGFAVAVVVSALLGFVFALLMRQAHHFYFAVATLGLAELILLVLRRWDRLVGRPGGEIRGVQDVSILGVEIDSRYRHFYLWLVLLGTVLTIAALIERSPLRRAAIAARDNHLASETVGVSVQWPGIVLFTLGCTIAGAAGSLFVHTRGFGTPETFGIQLGIGIFVVLILGGMHSIFGALLGAWFYIYIPEYLERWEEWTQVIWGVVLIGVMILFPEGIVGLWHRVIEGRDRITARVRGGGTVT